MHKIDLLTLDFNLLLVLSALLEERNVTNAGEKIGLSQSATSHALGRLRQVFNDPLLVRSAKGMTPTPRALELLEPLQKILLNIEQLIQPTVFDPKTAQGTIRLGASDYATAVILPSVLNQISRAAPQLNLECNNWRSDILDDLRNGVIDLGLGVLNLPETEEFKSQKLLVEDYLCVIRADHPIAQTNFTLESYIALPHGFITPANIVPSPTKTHVDNVLSNLGVKRRVMLKIPHFLSVPLIVQQTDLIFTLPRRIAMLFAKYTNLAVLEPPIELGNYNYIQVWHERCHYDPQHIWLRELVASQTQQL
ncbi:LysR family transcriptional regulator [Hassallia byssoidea VB512170]|uniref:LysR family transcriptional regulator n=1 Tax=Hassallia byssoidea VB512170 TaxID=1304833 RepID=A0A846HE43_9CYAN|nr:LysR family transcriptional regulator [Hassalia byssoidea]NEU75049.1 LysR family transcriptional regulator [Hassalia byssoidea VB512170]